MAASGAPVVLITGCTEGGIGHALAIYLHCKGCRVFGTVRRREAAPKLEEIGVALLALDVTDDAQCAAAVAHVLETAGRLDVLVNNAGVVTLGPACEVAPADVEAAFRANVFGALSMARAAHAEMAARGGGGKIVNVGSLTGLQPVPFRGVYSATKAALLRLSDAMRIELAPVGVQVCYVAPGFIDTRARVTARANAAAAPQAGSLWGGWLAALDAAMAKRLAKAVPVERYAAALGDVILRPRLPRQWIGETAGIEWLPRFLPARLRDRVLSRALAVDAVAPQLRANVAARAAQVAAQQGGAAQQQGQQQQQHEAAGARPPLRGDGDDGDGKKRR